jgi:hypothetical protein
VVIILKKAAALVSPATVGLAPKRLANAGDLRSRGAARELAPFIRRRSSAAVHPPPFIRRRSSAHGQTLREPPFRLRQRRVNYIAAF